MGGASLSIQAKNFSATVRREVSEGARRRSDREPTPGKESNRGALDNNPDRSRPTALHHSVPTTIAAELQRLLSVASLALSETCEGVLFASGRGKRQVVDVRRLHRVVLDGEHASEDGADVAPLTRVATDVWISQWS